MPPNIAPVTVSASPPDDPVPVTNPESLRGTTLFLPPGAKRLGARRDPDSDRDFVRLNCREAAFEEAKGGLGDSALIGIPSKSGTGVPHSKTLARSTGKVGIPNGLGVRRDSAAFLQVCFQLSLLLVFAFAIVSCKVLSPESTSSPRLTLNFNPDWKFTKADAPGAAAPAFNDADWTHVSAPHTYNDVDTFDHWSILGHHGEQDQWGGRTWYRKTFTVPESYKGKKVYIEFEAVRQVAEVYLNGKFLGVDKTGFAPFGFDLTPGLRFGEPNVLAVMCDNRFMKDPIGRAGGRYRGGGGGAGRSSSSATDATTGAATPGAASAIGPGPTLTNVISSIGTNAVSASRDLNIAPPPSADLAAQSRRFNTLIPEKLEDLQADQIPWNNPHWHPAHGGIYRNVRLYVMDPLHISLPLYDFLRTVGPYVYSTEISDDSAVINLEAPIENGRSTDAGVELTAQVLDRRGRTVLKLSQDSRIASGTNATIKVSGRIVRPELWQPDYPYLYRLVCQLRSGGAIVDSVEIPFGIRQVRWDVSEGFFINGQHVKLHGWGQKPTDEWPGLGAAQPDWMHFYTLDLMKEAGGNWVRWGHCLAGRVQIEACDRLGLMVEQPGVDGESDTVRAAWELRAMAFRDTVIYYRNNPSILIWEGGNQKVTRDHAKELRGYMDEYDPRGGRAYAHRRSDAVDQEFMDVCIGTEGGREARNLPVIEGEYDREESPRRVWDDSSPPNFGYPEAVGRSQYVLTSEDYAVSEVPNYVRKVGATNHCGGANWIFSDSTSGGRDAAEVARASGEVDGVRLPKEAYYVCAAMFRSDPQVHVIGHWNYGLGTNKTIYVASNGEDVELLVNGKSLGHGAVSDRYLFTFTNVEWAAGEIKAVARRGGKIVATDSKHTIGPPVALRLTPLTGPGGLRADGSDVALIDIEAVDGKGERCPTFQQRVDFEITGPGIWRGGYNSGKTNSINNLYLDLECGVNRVSVRATREAGTITVRARCAGIKPGSITIRSERFNAGGGLAMALPETPAVRLTASRPSRGGKDWWLISATRRLQGSAQAKGESAPGAATPDLAGKFVDNFLYSGPTAGARIEQAAQDGKKIYADRDLAFASLPDALKGADYAQALNADRLYSAEDLMELTIGRGSIVYVAHDDRLRRPDWLTRQFRATSLSLTVDGKPMTLFRHRAAVDESLTLGSNTEDPKAPACNMYVVFVTASNP